MKNRSEESEIKPGKKGEIGMGKEEGNNRFIEWDKAQTFKT